MKVPLLNAVIVHCYEMRSPRTGWHREHPYDSAHGVRTSGSLPGFMLTAGSNAYAAAQPSIIRRALGFIPEPDRCHFIDIGCGKGRALLIASEFGFAAITGIEISPALTRLARRNAAVFARTYPERTQIKIVTGDAMLYRLPEAPLAVFLYNPFDERLMTQLLGHIEASLRAVPRPLYLIYYNPAWAKVLDASGVLERRYAGQLAYAPAELGYGPDTSDAVVIWQNRGNPHPRPAGRPDAPVRVVIAGGRAEVVEPGGL